MDALLTPCFARRIAERQTECHTPPSWCSLSRSLQLSHDVSTYVSGRGAMDGHIFGPQIVVSEDQALVRCRLP